MSRDTAGKPAALQRLPGLVRGAAAGAAALPGAFGARASSVLPLSPLAWRSLRGLNQRRIRARCAVVPIGDGVAVCRVLGRFKAYVDPMDHAHAVHLMLDGFWEMHVTQVVASLLRPGMVAVDVGANQGYYTLLMAALVGPQGHVHAVEPNGRMTALLRRTLMANGLAGRVTLHEQPVGAHDGDEVVLHVDEGLPSGGFVEPASGAAGSLRTVTLDTVLAGGGADFVKIDAEGAEVAAWTGMAGTLARGRPMTVVMEFVLDRARDPAGFLAGVQRQGFGLSHIHNGRGIQPVTAERILASRGNQEWMLLLRR